MKDENTLYWLWLAGKCGIASKDFGKLIARYENPFEIYRMESDEIDRIEGIHDGTRLRLQEKSLEEAYSILRYCKQNRIRIYPYGHERYPDRLRNIEDPPVLLYSLGELPDLNNRLCIGMVGTRKMTEYGKENAYRIACELAGANAVVVSGMALGVDGVCACGALAAGGETIAVLGCGVSVVYPKEHERLMRAIAAHGAVISEYPPSERPNAVNFPKRNRLISGLCQGVLIIEASRRSGALITASHAIRQGRELFALPGKVGESNSSGPNELIRSGANMTVGAEDILRHYDFLYHDVIRYRGLRSAQKYSGNSDAALKKYGVSFLCYRGRYDEDENAADKAETPATGNRSFDGEPEPKQPVPEKTAPQKNDPEPQKSAPPTPPSGAEEAILASLDDTSRAVYEKMPAGRAVTPDLLVGDGIGMGEAITSLTMLELGGLVTSLPGGVYIRR